MEQVLKSKIETWSVSPNPLLRTLARSLRALGHVRRFFLNPRIRSENLTRALHRDAHFQGATYSEPNRYPELFAACKLHLQNIPTPTILSFGCATGEEAISLAEYLPNTTIVGVDINHWCLRQCRRSNRNPRIRFLHAHSRDFAALSNLDAIFCMAVFQRSENRNNTVPVAHGKFTFAKFEQEIRRLDRKLSPGGLFFIDHSDFSFEDTSIAAHYTPLQFAGNRYLHHRPLFDRNNQLIATQHSLHRAFVKQSVSPQP
jgi:SAM-dependent methyltransferase